jgi:hypothetical protein
MLPSNVGHEKSCSLAALPVRGIAIVRNLEPRHAIAATTMIEMIPTLSSRNQAGRRIDFTLQEWRNTTDSTSPLPRRERDADLILQPAAGRLTG